MARFCNLAAFSSIISMVSHLIVLEIDGQGVAFMRRMTQAYLCQHDANIW